MKSVGIATLIIALIIFSSPLRSEEKADAADMLCGNAPKGSVERLPDIVTNWTVVLCTPTGQVLAPAAKGKAILWVAVKTGVPWILEAVPRQFQRPDTLSKYDLRFTNFAAGERTGQGLQQALSMWDLAFAPMPRPHFDRVVQLDARTVWGGMIFNLFFYISQSQPRWLIACSNQCKESVALKVEERKTNSPASSAPARR